MTLPFCPSLLLLYEKRKIKMLKREGEKRRRDRRRVRRKKRRRLRRGRRRRRRRGKKRFVFFYFYFLFYFFFSFLFFSLILFLSLWSLLSSLSLFSWQAKAKMKELQRAQEELMKGGDVTRDQLLEQLKLVSSLNQDLQRQHRIIFVCFSLFSLFSLFSFSLFLSFLSFPLCGSLFFSFSSWFKQRLSQELGKAVSEIDDLKREVNNLKNLPPPSPYVDETPQPVFNLMFFYLNEKYSFVFGILEAKKILFFFPICK